MAKGRLSAGNSLNRRFQSQDFHFGPSHKKITKRRPATKSAKRRKPIALPRHSTCGRTWKMIFLLGLLCVSCHVRGGECESSNWKVGFGQVRFPAVGGVRQLQVVHALQRPKELGHSLIGPSWPQWVNSGWEVTYYWDTEASFNLAREQIVGCISGPFPACKSGIEIFSCSWVFAMAAFRWSSSVCCCSSTSPMPERSRMD